MKIKRLITSIFILIVFIFVTACSTPSAQSGESKEKTFVWVQMGRHNREQMAYVDSVKWCSLDKVPYPYEKARRILRQATKEESLQAQKEWKEEQTIYL